MIKLNVGNIFTNVEGDLPHTNYKQLEQKLSFRPQGYVFSPNFQRWIRDENGKPIRRVWDGWKRLCWKNKKTTYFPTGLLSLAVEFFKENDIPFKCVNNRHKPEKNIHIETRPGFEFRDYQTSIINTACEIGRGIIQAPTGAGKTSISAGIIQQLGVSPFIYFVTSIDLLTQAKESLQDILLQNGSPLRVGQIGAGVIDIADVNVMTIQTAVRALGEKWNKDTKFDTDDTDDDTEIEFCKKDIVDLINNAKGAISDECITGDSIIITREGPIRMDDLKTRIGQDVQSFDGNGIVWKKITHFYPKGKQRIIKVLLSNGMNIRCTADHLLMAKNGWMEAGKLQKGNLILCTANVDVCNTSYVRVESIEECGEEEVFDISVEDTHCFFANGILVHNCQHWRASTCQLVTRELKSAYNTFALSATPYRDDGDDMLVQACFGRIIAKISFSELIDRGYLVQPNIKMIHIRQPKSAFKQWQSIYKEQVVENEYYNNLVCHLANKFCDANRLVLVLSQQVAHGQYLASKINDAIYLSGNSPKKKRQQGIDQLRKKEISCISSSVIFDEGIDIRPLDTVILAGQGKSKVRTMQRIGRALRPWQDENGKKEKATIIDFHIHQKYLDDHAKERLKMYKSEPRFKVEEIEGKP